MAEIQDSEQRWKWELNTTLDKPSERGAGGGVGASPGHGSALV